MLHYTKYMVSVLILFLVSTVLVAADYFRLVEEWQTKKIFSVPESVCYDSVNDVLYVSNINGKPTEKNGRGFISKVGLNKEIYSLRWVEGLNAPKGMAVVGNKLYVSDIDRLAEIDISSGKIEKFYPAAKAGFLNDVAADSAGNIFVSDMSADNSVIYRLENGQMQVWLSGESIKSPNGLFIREDTLFIGNSGDGMIKAVNLSSKEIGRTITVGSGIDGLVGLENGGFLVSDWSGKTSLVEPSGSIVVLLDTTDDKINSADFGFVPGQNLLVIPTFYEKRLIAYKLIMEQR